MAPKVHIWAHDRSTPLRDIEGAVIDADDLSVGDVIRVSGQAWTVTNVRRAGEVTELTIEPPDGNGTWPGPLSEVPPPLID